MISYDAVIQNATDLDVREPWSFCDYKHASVFVKTVSKNSAVDARGEQSTAVVQEPMASHITANSKGSKGGCKSVYLMGIYLARAPCSILPGAKVWMPL